ncbi:MAG: sigma-70 family RNA polymerase sigma factor [Acidobacteria bacterium]|nr:sigma-70 family RNA polymerase sigma factor [Acidobacteriota bacterium]
MNADSPDAVPTGDGIETVPPRTRPRPGENAWANYVRRAAAGDQAALGALYDATHHLVYGAALRIVGNTADAEEVTLDVFTQVWKSAASFDGQRGPVISWLMTLTRSRAIDRLRSQAGRSRLEAPLSAFPDVFRSTLPSPESAWERSVRAALETLAPDQRELIDLAYYSGYTHSELAVKLGQPLGTIKTRIRAAMTRLRALLVDGEARERQVSHVA